MTEFSSWRSYWAFERATKHEARYVWGAEVEAFLEIVRHTAGARTQTLPADSFLWRAQLGHDWSPVDLGDGSTDDMPVPHPPSRMKPVDYAAAEGRANPKGIPYLYLATDRDTALAEVRPWIGSLVSVGQFRTLRDLRLVNCSLAQRGQTIHLTEPPPEERAKAVWGDIDRAFAKPVDPSDDIGDYVPTQIVAEVFKTSGYDGVAYRSSLGTGLNMALFDLRVAHLVNCSLYEAKQVTFRFEQAANPYFVEGR